MKIKFSCFYPVISDFSSSRLFKSGRSENARGGWLRFESQERMKIFSDGWLYMNIPDDLWPKQCNSSIFFCFLNGY